MKPGRRVRLARGRLRPGGAKRMVGKDEPRPKTSLGAYPGTGLSEATLCAKTGRPSRVEAARPARGLGRPVRNELGNRLVI